MRRRRWPSPSTRTWSSNSRRRVPTKRSAKAFMFGVRTAVRTTLVPTASNRLANRARSLASRSTTSTSGWMSKGCVSRLLRTPVIGRRPGDCSIHDSPSLQIEKEQDEDRAEEHVEGLHEVTSPGNVVAEESTPAVAVAGHPLLHVPLHGAFRDPDSKLEQLTSKPLGAPPWVSRRHLADQRRVACRPSAARS